MCKNCNHELEGKYNPKEFEENLYQKWEKKEYFKPSGDTSKGNYCIMMPPPNVTGKLHMGHALDGTLQDILIRFKRMQGFNTLWLPGTDHAAISTEVKVVESLLEQGITKSDIGREGFIEKCWDWTHEYGGTIVKQQKKLGLSSDWSRSRFTMDEMLSRAVLKVFKDLYDKGLIYKGKRMINWCPCCNTSISDAEVEYKEEPTHLWHIRYKITGTEDRYITVATTRPETMLGDTAVAVHPDDERYKDIIGKTCILPIMNKEIPIIADEFVEKEFGTGCVKITPAHDPNDYQAGLRHNLEIIEVFDENFKMGDLYPGYKGMDLYEAREKIVEKLKELGNLVKIEDYNHNVAKHDRCSSTVEPKVSSQWFVAMKELAKPAIDAVKNGDTRFVPQKFEKTYFNWLENIQDWCISRQLWWGYQIPVYYCKDCGEMICDVEKPSSCKCGSANLVQDEDTLDTWFSSALWPFATLGWPEETEDYKNFYPNNVLVTGYDIIFFWVVRMMFSGLAHTNEVPFKDVLIHGIVRDSQGRKMSKSLGNGIDPLDVIEKYGTDALRFSLVSGTTAGNDMRFMEDKLDMAGNFANKIWNAAKFVLMNLKNADTKILEENDYSKVEFSIEDKWILSKLNTLVKEVQVNIDNYDLGVALDKIYSFIWNEFCDWYIEMVKPRLYDEENLTKNAAYITLNKVLCDSLKLLHPFMPFVTEKIYNELYNEDESIMISKWPDYDEGLAFKVEEADIELIKEIITGIRNVRNNMNVHPSKKSKIIFVTKTKQNAIKEGTSFIQKLGFAEELIIQEEKTDIPENAISLTVPEVEIFIPFEELVDIEAEKARLEQEKKKLEAEVSRGTKMLANPGFISKAPESKIKEEEEKLKNYKEMLAQVEERLMKL